MVLLDTCRANAKTQEAHLANGNAVQVIGKVNPDLSIKVLSSRDLGTGFGRYSTYNAPPSNKVFILLPPSAPWL